MASQNPSSDKAEIISAIMGKAEVDSPVLSVKSLDENVDVHGLPVKSYLEQTVVPVLIEGLTALSRERPPNPVEYLAAYLLKYNPQK